MIVCADVQARKLVLSWQEGVAIVRELADTLGRADSTDQVPDLAHVAIRTSGEIEILQGSPPAQLPVRRLAAGLEALIEGTEAPPELWALASDNAGATPKHASVEKFADALAIFERPGRRADIARVAARDSGADASSPKDKAPVKGEAPAKMDTEIRQLRDKARLARQARAEQERAEQRKRQWTVPIIAAGAVLLLIYTGLATAVWVRESPQGEQAAAEFKAWITGSENRVAKVLRSVARADLPGLRGLSLFRDDAPASEADESAPPSRAARGGTNARRSGAGPGESGDEPESARDDTQPGFELLFLTEEEGLIAPRGGEADSGQAHIAGAPVVYTPADADVVPPTMLRQYLPSAPPAQAAGAGGVFDIVVSETGEVEKVHLISTDYPFHEKMLVSAAKAWRFHPARREGRPVKYRLAVRITGVARPLAGRSGSE